MRQKEGILSPAKSVRARPQKNVYTFKVIPLCQGTSPRSLQKDVTPQANHYQMRQVYFLHQKIVALYFHQLRRLDFLLEGGSVLVLLGPGGVVVRERVQVGVKFKKSG